MPMPYNGHLGSSQVPDVYDFDDVDEMGLAHLAALREVRDALCQDANFAGVHTVDDLALAYVTRIRDERDEEDEN